MPRPVIHAYAVIFLLCLHAPPDFAHDSRREGLRKTSAGFDTVSLNANRVWTYFNNRGSLRYQWGWGGSFWQLDWLGPRYAHIILFDVGVGLIGKVNGELRLAVSQWGTSYAPGPAIDGKPALWVRPQDSVRYRPYKITKGDSLSTNPDYAQWPADLGAPTDLLGRPKLYGDQTIWMVYNNLDTTARPSGWRTPGAFLHAALEIQQLAYCRQSTLCDSVALLANVVFFEWTIINKETVPIDSTYVVIWTDIDFAGTNTNMPAVDTLRQLPYCWDEDYLPWYSSRPMAVGYLPLSGPILPSLGDTALFRGSKRPGYRNLGMTSFWPILDDCSYGRFCPAYNSKDLWNVARGLDKSGLPLVDSTSGEVTKFPFSGDPVAGTGWVCPAGATGGGSGFYMFFGPFTMAPNDTQWLRAALVPARGKDHFDAIQVLRAHAEQLHAMPYDSLLLGRFGHIECEAPFVPSAIQLFQNFPNPFNSGTTITYDIDRPAHVRLTIYDLLGREVAALVDDPRNRGRFSVEFRGRGLASGVYFYRLTAGNSALTRKLVLLK